MGIKTAIEYADSTINPVMGCTGCELLKDHCYAQRLCRRYAGRKGWPAKFTEPEHFPGRLERAIRWPDLTGTKRPDKPWLDGMPRVVFVNDLSDGFCPGGVDADRWLAPLVPAMASSPHTWLLLTKWPDKMRRWMGGLPWVPANFWLGTTLLRQSDTWRLEEILQIEGGKKWASFEPLLSSIDIARFLPCLDCGGSGYVADGRGSGELCGCIPGPTLDWIVTGGETGPGARPMDPSWVRGLRDQCQAAGTSFFFKQWGEWAQVGETCEGGAYSWPGDDFEIIQKYPHVWMNADGETGERATGIKGFCRVGKKHAGHYLDGQAWREMPGQSELVRRDE